MWRMRASWIGVAVTPAFGYPALASALFAWDTIRGERLFAYYVTFDRRALWDHFWTDYAHSLPVFYAGVAVAFLIWLGLRRVAGLASLAWLVAVTAVVGWASGFVIAGTPLDSAAVALALVGAVVGAALAGFVGAARRGAPA